jgi:predicted RNA-binding Zn ribbon-like protein
MTVSSKFPFIGDAPAIDFLNTEVMRDGAPLDLLATESDVVDWLVDAGLLGRRLLPLRGGAHLLDDVRRLRAAFRALALRRAEGGKPKRRELAAIDEALARGRGRLTLDADLTLQFVPDHPDVLFLLARSIAEFLATADPSLVKACGGSGCILLFYDTTKSHTRRWCSMAGCGNRMKVAAHYARQKRS